MIRSDGGKFAVTQNFNDPCCRAAYFQFGMQGHNGRDYATPFRTPLIAPISGETYVGYEPKGYGKFLFITNKQLAVEVVVAHMDEITVGSYKQIKQGDPIGFSGNSGNVRPKPTPANPKAGAHTHEGIRPLPYDRNNGFLGYVDPAPFYRKGEDNKPVQGGTPMTYEEERLVLTKIYENLYPGSKTPEQIRGDVQQKLDQIHVLKSVDFYNVLNIVVGSFFRDYEIAMKQEVKKQVEIAIADYSAKNPYVKPESNQPVPEKIPPSKADGTGQGGQETPGSSGRQTSNQGNDSGSGSGSGTNSDRAIADLFPTFIAFLRKVAEFLKKEVR